MKIQSKTITLSYDTASINHLCKVDKRLAKLISQVGTLSYTPYSDGYSFLVHEIIEQMLSIKAGAKIYERLKNLCNGNITPDSIMRLSADQIKNCGTSNTKVQYIQGLTSAVVSGELQLVNLTYMTDKEVINELTKLRGIGNWTAKMYLIFVLNRQNVLPFEDGAFIQVYKWLYKTNDISVSSIEKKCKKWKPYSSIAARYMYRALDLGYTKEEFHLYK